MLLQHTCDLHWILVLISRRHHHNQETKWLPHAWLLFERTRGLTTERSSTWQNMFPKLISKIYISYMRLCEWWKQHYSPCSNCCKVQEYLVPLLHVQTLFLHQPLQQLHTASTCCIMQQSAAGLQVCTVQTMHIHTNECKVSQTASWSLSMVLQQCPTCGPGSPHP